ncbi:MAG: DUF1365 domain-containing protein [Planctomycetes bacterium]|nr:DUF1365 domain-containing protein [Planctomycetota bacterium]
MASALYEGRVRHRRHGPRPHEFAYDVHMLFLDLGELDLVFRDRWLWSTSRAAPVRWQRGDYLGDPTRPLDECVRDLVAESTGQRPAGPVRLLTHPRYLGYGFNPVSFYYCHGAPGEPLEAIVAEVSNTPWRERHPYVLDLRSADRSTPGSLRWRFRKAFHVSPFMPMELDYDWRFTVPGESIVAHMENLDGAERVFDATLTLQRREISALSLASVLARRPFMTAQVIAAIHWQAARLWLKRTPFHEHPKWKTQPSGRTR